MVHDDVEIPAVDVVFADQFRLIGLIDRRLQPFALADEFTSNINVAMVRGHRGPGDQATLDEKMRIVPHDLAVLASAGLGFVGIDDEVMRPVHLLGHERPFQPGRESGAAAAALAGSFAFVDERVAASFQDRLGAVPSAADARAVEAPIALTVEIFENAVFVGEHYCLSFAANSDGSVSVVDPPTGAELMRSICGPGFGVRPLEKSLMMRVKISGVRSS